MRDPLPETLIPRRAGQQALTVNGALPEGATPRLAESYTLRAPVTVNLLFDTYGDDKVLVTGQLGTRVMGQCQRCLEPFETGLETEVEVEFGPEDSISDGEREIIPGIDKVLNLAEFVEDELLLGAPMVALHDEGTCVPPGEAPVQEAVVAGRRRPFGELGSLLGRKEPD